MVEFASVPAQTLVPFTYVEISNQALVVGPSVQPYKGLLVGMMLSGTATALEPLLVTSPEQAYGAFGAGSQLAKMAAAWFANNRSTELWAVPLADAVGTAATATLTVTGPATAAGTIAVYVGGQRFTVSVAVADTAIEVAAAIVAAIPVDLVATGAVGANPNEHVVTLTMRHSALFGNNVDLRLSYGRGEEVPAGIAIAISASGFTGGAGSPDYSTVWATVPATQFNVLALGDEDATNLGYVENELEDRWLPDSNQEGTAFYGNDNSLATLVSDALAVDSRFLVQVSTELCPTPRYELAAIAAGIAAASLAASPSRPMQTLRMAGALAPKETDRHTLGERETLLANGCATIFPDAGGTMRIERLVTTYLTNSQAAPDTSFRDVQTVASLSYMRYDLKNRFAAKFARSMLASDGVVAGAGLSVVTPAIAKAFIAGVGEQWAELMIIEDAKSWRDNVHVERNPQDPNRLDVSVSGDLVNQLRVTAMRMDFKL